MGSHLKPVISDKGLRELVFYLYCLLRANSFILEASSEMVGRFSVLEAEKLNLWSHLNGRSQDLWRWAMKLLTMKPKSSSGCNFGYLPACQKVFGGVPEFLNMKHGINQSPQYYSSSGKTT